MSQLITDTLESSEVISRLRGGDIEAFEFIYKLYYPRLKNYGTRLGCDEKQAEDFVQETFAGIWEKRFLLHEKGNLKSLLFTAVRNRYLNYFEHNKVVDKFIRANDTNDSSQKLYMLNFLEEKEIEEYKNIMMNEVRRLLDTLPENCKNSFILSRLQNLKNREIAEELGLNIKTVEKHIARAMKLLKDELRKKDVLLYLLFLYLFIK